jgi:hypothetical protein
MTNLDRPIRYVPVELSPPPASPQPWLCWRRGEPEKCRIVKAQTWSVARAKAAVSLGCEPGEVVAKLPEEEK